MEINVTSRNLDKEPAVADLVSFLRTNESRLGLEDATLYYNFPVLKDLEDVVVISKLLCVSPKHGVVAFAPSSITSHATDVAEAIVRLDSELEHIFPLLYSRLIRNRVLRNGKTNLAFPTATVVYTPFLDGPVADLEIDALFAGSHRELETILASTRTDSIDPRVYTELVATIEGAKGMIRPKARPASGANKNSKGNLATGLEGEISSFDQRQKLGAIGEFDGLQRVRGLAGSGKTVVLAMKAALMHLKNPNANILYTFHTRSLYQHIQRLITRFYRQFDDKDPDWERLRILHAWGGRSTAGVYYNACTQAGVSALDFREASALSRDPFGYACQNLLASGMAKPAYDYVFVDEGQDFPTSFIQLCVELAEEKRVVFAYDDLQTIFQAKTPDLREIVGIDANGNPRVELTEDVVLYKCYRNPREILVCAHALGFGIYGQRIIQMLENREQWEDVGYRVLEGEFREGSATVIERPKENSLAYISDNQTPADLVQCVVCASYEEEIERTAISIEEDIREGLRPDDILVVVVDDRNAKTYLRALERKLDLLEIQANNMHSDSFGIRDFSKEGAVTLSTVHKAKGNEAFMVYVLGVDALFGVAQSVRDRNLLFTAMTRAKGWIRVMGVGDRAAKCKDEIDVALRNFPNLAFTYPSAKDLRVLRRDLAASAQRKQRAERKIDALLNEMSAEEIREYLDSASNRARKGS